MASGNAILLLFVTVVVTTAILGTYIKNSSYQVGALILSTAGLGYSAFKHYQAGSIQLLVTISLLVLTVLRIQRLLIKSK